MVSGQCRSTPVYFNTALGYISDIYKQQADSDDDNDNDYYYYKVNPKHRSTYTYEPTEYFTITIE